MDAFVEHLLILNPSMDLAASAACKRLHCLTWRCYKEP